jgi:hypothetical protein
MQKGKLTDTGARTGDRNELAANWYTISRSVWNMHDALLQEQRRTNQLLEALLEHHGAQSPAAIPLIDAQGPGVPTDGSPSQEQLDYVKSLLRSLGLRDEEINRHLRRILAARTSADAVFELSERLRNTDAAGAQQVLDSYLADAPPSW